MRTLLRNATILTMQDDTPHTFIGWLAMEGNTIDKIGVADEGLLQYTESHTPCTTIDCTGKLIMPGLINSHTHVPMTLQRGMADDIDVIEWLYTKVWPFEACQTDEDILAGARLGIAEMLLSGTTTFVDMYWSESYVARAVTELGIRAHLAESVLDTNIDALDGKLSLLVEQANNSPLITAAVAPHAPYSCKPQTLQTAAALAKKYALPITTHLLESPKERAMMLEQGVSSPLHYLIENDIVTPSTILAHCVHLTPEDLDVLAQTGATVCYNPQSNMKIASGVAPITEMQKRGINVAIGTDGACSNNDLDMWDEIRSGAILQKLATMDALTLPAYEVLKMATVNGAKALGREGELGVLKEGALADIIIIDLIKPHLQPQHNVISSLVYAMKASDIEMVFVNGVLRVERGKLLGANLSNIIEDASRRAMQIITKQK